MNFKTIRNLALVVVATLAGVFGALNATAGRITLGSLTTLNTSTHLDPMFTELYELREVVTTPSYTATTPRLSIASGGSVGLGVSPSAWGSSYRSLQMFTYGSIYDTNGGDFGVASNAYHNGTNWIFRTNNPAARYELGPAGDRHSFYTSSSGSAGGTVTWSEQFRISSSGAQIVGAGGLGYGAGSGGAVTQTTSKSTTVTLNKASGQITMNSAALAAGATVTFAVSNSLVGGNDVVFVNALGGNNNYRVETASTSGGGFSVRVTNVTGGSLSEALPIQFVLMKGATS